MFKELDGISTVGLSNDEYDGLKLIDLIYNNYQDYLMPQAIELVKEHVYDNNFKETEPELLKLTGVYKLDVDISNDTPWHKDFKCLFYNYVNGALKQIINAPRTETTQAKIDTLRSLYYTIVDSSELGTGYIAVDDRKVKIMRYIKAQLNKVEKISPTEFEQLDFVQLYAKHKTSNHAYLVLSNSVSSILGMSAFTPLSASQDNGRAWTSCQNVTQHARGYAKGIMTNLLDKGLLIGYITNGDEVGMYREDSVKHQVMHSRFLVRMLYEAHQVRCECGLKNTIIHYMPHTCPTCGTVIQPKREQLLVVPDRFYPNTMYANQVMELLTKLCAKHDLRLGTHMYYNCSQMDKKSFNPTEWVNPDKPMGTLATTIKPIKKVFGYCDGDCSECNHSTWIPNYDEDDDDYDEDDGEYECSHSPSGRDGVRRHYLPYHDQASINMFDDSNQDQYETEDYIKTYYIATDVVQKRTADFDRSLLRYVKVNPMWLGHYDTMYDLNINRVYRVENYVPQEFWVGLSGFTRSTATWKLLPATEEEYNLYREGKYVHDESSRSERCESIA